MRRVQQLGEGEVSSFVTSKWFGDNLPIEKAQCIGHEQWQMGSRLGKSLTLRRRQARADGEN